MRAIVLILAFLPVLSWGTSSDDLLLPLDASLEPTVQMSRSDMNADLDVLAYAAGRGYSGPGLSEALARVRAALPETADSLTFCQLLENSLIEIRDTHLRASLVTQSCSSRQVKGGVGKNIRTGAWGWDSIFTSAGRINVLALPSFPPSADDEWKGFIGKVRDIKTEGRPFVIDLRGNTGGDETMGMELARVLYGLDDKDPIPTPLEARLRRETPEAFALTANAWTFQIIKAKREKKQPPLYMYKWRVRNLEWMHLAKTGKYPEINREVFEQPDLRGKDVFQGKVYVLVDRLCGSSCENLLQFLEKLPGRVLVGENSMGAVNYGNMGKAILPHSRVSVHLATFTNRFSDFRQVEEVGYAPDVPVAAGNDAMAAALSEITK